MKTIFALLSLFAFSTIHAQVVKKENLTKKVNLYWDFNKTQLQATGSYYKDEVDETSDKHGKWLYYDRFGVLEEERNYYKEMLQGKVVLYYPNKKLKQEGYFYLNRQDSVYREWFENGNLSIEGYYSGDKPLGKWTYYYIDGSKKSEEEMIGDVNHLISFWSADSTHKQTITDGTGVLSTYYTTGREKEWYNY